ncbi:MAG: hypothetical protein K2X81_19165 [Candidatus Obscuribacterales bacterium]|nr:hypothetical protein [Candidatus Obscuribacterales bacterium]
MKYEIQKQVFSLLAFILATSFTAVRAGADATDTSSKVPAEAVKASNRDSALGNGFYLVLRQAEDPSSLSLNNKSEHAVINDYHFLEPAERDIPKYCILSTDEFIPLTLGAEPGKGSDPKGRPMLSLQLAENQVAPLEEFTRKHLGNTIAIVIDGQIVTTHKIKSVISGGRLQITRCSDSGCTVLYSVLQSNKK